MKKSIFLVFTIIAAGIFIVVISANSSGPVKYSKKLIQEYEKVQEELSSLEEAIDSRSFLTLKMLRKKSKLLIFRSIAKINQMDDYEGDVKFRAAVLNLLDFYDRFVQDDLLELLDICQKDRSARSDYDLSRLDQVKEDFFKREKNYLRDVQKAKDEFI